MSKLYDELKGSLEEALDVAKGRRKPSRVFEYDDVEITSIRRNLKMSQQDFADLIGISKATIENWEQGRRRPTGATRALLKILKAKPRSALTILQA